MQDLPAANKGLHGNLHSAVGSVSASSQLLTPTDSSPSFPRTIARISAPPAAGALVAPQAPTAAALAAQLVSIFAAAGMLEHRRAAPAREYESDAFTAAAMGVGPRVQRPSKLPPLPQQPALNTGQLQLEARDEESSFSPGQSSSTGPYPSHCFHLPAQMVAHSLWSTQWAKKKTRHILSRFLSSACRASITTRLWFGLDIASRPSSRSRMQSPVCSAACVLCSESSAISAAY